MQCNWTEELNASLWNSQLFIIHKLIYITTPMEHAQEIGKQVKQLQDGQVFRKLSWSIYSTHGRKSFKTTKNVQQDYVLGNV